MSALGLINLARSSTRGLHKGMRLSLWNGLLSKTGRSTNGSKGDDKMDKLLSNIKTSSTKNYHGDQIVELLKEASAMAFIALWKDAIYLWSEEPRMERDVTGNVTRIVHQDIDLEEHCDQRTNSLGEATIGMSTPQRFDKDSLTLHAISLLKIISFLVGLETTYTPECIGPDTWASTRDLWQVDGLCVDIEMLVRAARAALKQAKVYETAEKLQQEARYLRNRLKVGAKTRTNAKVFMDIGNVNWWKRLMDRMDGRLHHNYQLLDDE